jgi:hypothetical protein
MDVTNSGSKTPEQRLRKLKDQKQNLQDQLNILQDQIGIIEHEMKQCGIIECDAPKRKTGKFHYRFDMKCTTSKELESELLGEAGIEMIQAFRAFLKAKRVGDVVAVGCLDVSEGHRVERE